MDCNIFYLSDFSAPELFIERRKEGFVRKGLNGGSLYGGVYSLRPPLGTTQCGNFLMKMLNRRKHTLYGGGLLPPPNISNDTLSRFELHSLH